MLNIEFRTNKLKRVCTDYGKAKKEYGERMAQIIHQRIGEISAAESVEMLVQYSVGRCHPLKGNREGEYAMDLVQPYRLIFSGDEQDMRIVRIMKIEDYH